ncbi:MAG: hypothetical protein ACRD5J_00925, partial [Nitrososphaeraceae archaeon]
YYKIAQLPLRVISHSHPHCFYTSLHFDQPMTAIIFVPLTSEKACYNTRSGIFQGVSLTIQIKTQEPFSTALLHLIRHFLFPA